MTLVSIDPGKTALGWACFNNQVLAHCGLIRSKSIFGMANVINNTLGGLYPDDVVIEIPQVYQQRMGKGDPNDLIDVGIVAGMVTSVLGEFDQIQMIRPRRWKGTRPKNICNALTLKTLDVDERKVFEEIEVIASLRHNVIDAIGIGLWRLGRR